MAVSDEFNDFEKKLTSTLYRFDCPGPFELGNFHSGLLPEEEIEEIKNHVTICPYCREELEDLEEFLAQDIPFTKSGLKTRQALNKIIPFVRNEVYYDTPEIKTALRGGKEGREDTKKIRIKYNESEFINMFYRIVQENERQILRGQFVVHEELEKIIINSLIELWQYNKIIATAQIDDLCSFRFPLNDKEPVIIRISYKAGVILSFQLNITT